MSKFIVHPRVWLTRAPYPLASLSTRRRRSYCSALELLEVLLDRRDVTRLGLQRDHLLVRRDRRGIVLDRLGGLREVEERDRIVGRDARQLLVDADRVPLRVLHLRDGVLEGRVHLRAQRGLDRIGPERLAELPSRLEDRRDDRRRIVELGLLCGQLERVRLREVEAGELAQRILVLRTELG